MLRSETKESIILLTFTALLSEFLTPMTIAFVVLGVVLVGLKIRPAKYVRNIVTLVIFGSYWFSYGKIIDPEVGLNFLTIIITLKMLEKETLRDRYMIFYGLILIIATGSLFVKSLMYVLFFAAAFFILIQDFYQGLRLKWKFREAGNALLWVLPLTAIFFFFIPRIMNPLSYQNFSKSDGEIGYSPDVNLSDIESLSSNDDIAFRATISGNINQSLLYWRGNTLSFSDGWNWPALPQDRQEVAQTPIEEFTPPEGKLLQNMRVYGKEDYYFGLDTPSTYVVGNRVYNLGDLATLPQKKWQTVQRYNVYSGAAPVEQAHALSRFIKHSLSQEDQFWIEETFQASTVSGLQKELSQYFVSEGFSYSLKPGKIDSFKKFMQSKKSGFCSHYSSSLALILRVKGIPSRLVSGFMGGVYNKFGGFFHVSQNDAHVWVEAYENNKWIRMDPTGWIAPERILSGGEAFMQATAGSGALQKLKFNLGFMTDFQLWFEQWDYRFYRWLEEMDYYGQEALLEKLKLKKEWFFTLAPLLLALFIALYTLQLYRVNQRKLEQNSESELLWSLFSQKLARKGLQLPLTSIEEANHAIQNFSHAEQENWVKIFRELVNMSFAKKSKNAYRLLNKEIKKL